MNGYEKMLPKYRYCFDPNNKRPPNFLNPLKLPPVPFISKLRFSHVSQPRMGDTVTMHLLVCTVAPSGSVTRRVSTEVNNGLFHEVWALLLME